MPVNLAQRLYGPRTDSMAASPATFQQGSYAYGRTPQAAPRRSRLRAAAGLAGIPDDSLERTPTLWANRLDRDPNYQYPAAPQASPAATALAAPPAAERLSQNDIAYRRDPNRAGSGQAVADVLQANPNGRFFQGAMLNPSTEQYPGRSTFIDPARPGFTEQDGAVAQGRFNLAGVRAEQAGLVYRDQNTGTIRPTADSHQRMAAQGLLDKPTPEMLAANRAAYQQRRGMELASRQDAVTQDAQGQRLARRDRMAGPSAVEMLAARDPRMAMQMAALQSQGQLANAQMQNQLAVQGLRNEGALGVANAETSGREAQTRAAFVAQLKASGVSDEEIPAAMQQAGLAPAGVNLAQQPKADANYQLGGVANDADMEWIEANKGDEGAVRSYLAKKRGLSGKQLDSAVDKVYGRTNFSKHGLLAPIVAKLFPPNVPDLARPTYDIEGGEAAQPGRIPKGGTLRRRPLLGQ